MRNTKLKGLIPFMPFVLAFFLALLLSWPNPSLATLTVSNTGLQGDTNITLDTNGTLGVGTASATAITIGQSSLNVSIPGSLTVSSATTTVNNLHVTGSCLGCSSASGITAIDGLTNATTSIAAGSGISIATSSPNIVTITATGGGASSTWSGLTNPTGNLSLSMGNFTTTFTAGSSATNPFLIQDTNGNTGTGPLLQVSTIGTSVALPVKFTAQGTTNGVQMNSSGALNAIGSGNINATQLQGTAVSTTTPTTNQVLTYNGTSWAPAAAGGGSLSGGQANYLPLWIGSSTLGTSTLQAVSTSLVTTGGFAIGTTTN